MRKVFAYIFIGMAALGTAALLKSINDGNVTLQVFCLFFSSFSAVFALIIEPKASERQQISGLSILIMGAVIAFIITVGTSCSRNGYGCKGNQSWEKMVKRNNRAY